MSLPIMDSIRMAQLVMEAGNDSDSMVTVAEHVAAAAVQQGMSQLSATVAKMKWVDDQHLQVLKNAKIYNDYPARYELSELGKRNAFTKAAPIIPVKTADHLRVAATPEDRREWNANWHMGPKGWESG